MQSRDERESRIGAVLFAAGRGERMRPLTDTVPKPALLVKGKPLGAYGLELLRDLGARIVVNLSWRPEIGRAALEPYAPPGTRWLVEEPHAYGTAGTLAALLGDLATTFVTLNGDTLTDLQPDELLATHRRIGAPVTVAVMPLEERADLEVEGDIAVRFIDRRAELGAPGFLFIGMAAFERDALAPLLEPGKVAGLGEVVLRPLAERGELAVHRHEGFALDVGTPESLEEARRQRNPR
jgi:MurNAc alpha-1-phosphate uridylyltransferase